MNRVAIVTGGSSGIGFAAVRALRGAGYTVYELSRHGGDNSYAVHISADVSDEAQVEAAFDVVREREGQLDLLVNCAGFGISGAAEFTAAEEASRQLAVNLIGTANSCKAAIPLMRGRGGTIINISSVAGAIAIPFQAWYSVSKAGINSYTAALANELRPFGIRVCALMPGDTKTGFTAARRKTAVGDEIYEGRITRSVATMEHDEENGESPELIARAVVRLAAKRRVKPLYTPSLKYKALVVVAKLLPCGLANRIVGLLYAK